MMGIQDFISYVDALPADCIEVKEKDTTQFHLPRNNEIVCPTCGSHYVYIDHYRTQRLRGLPDTAGAYIYNRRNRIHFFACIRDRLGIGCDKFERRKKLRRNR